MFGKKKNKNELSTFEALKIYVDEAIRHQFNIRINVISAKVMEKIKIEPIIKNYLIPAIREEIVDFYQKTEQALDNKLKMSAANHETWEKYKEALKIIQKEHAEMKEIIGRYIIKKEE